MRAEQNEQVEAATAEVRAEGKRQRGMPRAAAVQAAAAMAGAPAATAAEAVAQAEQGAEEALLSGWTATLPFAMLRPWRGGGWWHSGRRRGAWRQPWTAPA